MGLFGKISEKRMKDPVDGTLHVVGISTPDPTATTMNYRIDGVVSGPGIDARAVVHHGMMSVAKWPSPGQDLPVRVDRSNPEHLVIQTDRVPTGRAQTVDAAQALAASMRGEVPTGEASGLTPQSAATYGDRTTITVDGVPVDPAQVGVALAGAGLSGAELAGILASAGIGGPGVAPTGQPGPPVAATVSSADILARGTAGHATLLGTFPSPVQSSVPDRTTIGLMLNVLIDGRAPYQVENLYAVPNDKVSRLAPGTLLPVKVDPTTAGLVAVDWDAI